MPVSFSVHPILVIACLAAAAIFAYWTYGRTTPSISPGRRALLSSLRGLALAIVLFLLFDPVLRRWDVRHEPPLVAILADNSASLSLTADSLAIRNALSAVDWAGLEGEYRLFRFGDQVRDLGDAGSGADSLSGNDAETNIADGFYRVSDLLARENLFATVLISDGRANAGRNPAYVAEEMPSPVHTVIAGDTTRSRDVRVQEVLTNETAYSRAELLFSSRIVADGYEGEQVSVGLWLEGRLLDEQTISLGASGIEQRVELSSPPADEGLRRFTVSVTQLDGEATYRNNSLVIDVRIIDSRRHILLIAGSPHPDVGAFRQVIETDPSSELTTRIQQADGSFTEGPLPPAFDGVDLVLLVDYPNAATPTQSAEHVADGIRNSGAAVLYVAGRNPAPDRLNRLGDDILPSLPSHSAATSFEAQPVPTSRGTGHPVMAVEPPAEWSRLPPLHYPDAGWQPSADAAVLATVRSRNVDLNDPLVVVRTRTGRRSAAILGANLWMWRTVSPTLGTHTGSFDTFVDNLVRWLTAPDDNRRIRVRPLENRFDGVQSVRFTGEVYDESLEPVDDAEVQLDLESADGTTTRLVMDGEGHGRYRLDAGALPEGTYSYRARATADGVDLGTDAGSFSVGPSSLEYLATSADAALMRQIAARSGGTSTTLDGLETLLQEISSEADFLPRTDRTVRDASLRHVYVFLLIVIALLATEWVLRKRSGMV